MDPNACLGLILAHARGLRDADTDNMDLDDLRNTAASGCMLAEFVMNLDEWLTKGGFMPDRYQVPHG